MVVATPHLNSSVESRASPLSEVDATQSTFDITSRCERLSLPVDNDFEARVDEYVGRRENYT